ncbi:prostaglandin E synthase 2-like [Senna tora]|uniref:Prostaglandin E synthase 2 n=1 Tax=Senna tora TaxID=362788 RepID=A0A834WYW4_9FABA|nr:prostaglandin E synthase 2-like [Senna tora]
MRRASSLASSVLSRTIATAHGGVAASSAVQHRLLQAALYGSSSGNSHYRRRWFSSLLGSFSESSAHGASLGVAGALITVVAAATFSQEVYAKEPLPSEVLPKDVVLYQYEACPFCNKVKVGDADIVLALSAFLDYYDIRYKVVEVNPISKKEIKWSDYKKVPILMVDGEQLNDSSAIIDTLGEKIQVKKKVDSTSEDDEETKWRQWVDSHLVHVLSPNIYRNTSEALESFDYITSNGNFSFTERITVKYAGAAAMYFVSKNLKKKYNITDERAALYEAAETWVDALNGREFLGGSKPNLADLAVFGVLRPIRYLRSGKDMVEHTRIGEWYTRMENTVGESSRLKA